MDAFMQGLNVTIYGLGIVFLALLVLMFTIMVLNKVLQVTTGKEFFTAVPATSPRPTSAAPVQTAEEAPAAAEIEEEALPAGEILGQVTAPLPGKILSIAVKPGDQVHKGDEVCVIEAMKMGNSIKSELDGVIGELLVSPGDSVTFGAPIVTVASVAQTRVALKRAAAPAQPTSPSTAPTPAPVAPVSFKLGTSGKQHQVAVKPGVGNSVSVTIDGHVFEVQRDRTDPSKFVVDGKAHTVEVKETAGDMATVVVDGVALKVDVNGESVAATAVAAAQAFAASSFKMAIGIIQHQVEIKDPTESGATVVVDGVAFKVERGKANGKVVVVNGKPFVVEVRGRTSGSADVLLDGQPKSVQVFDMKAAAQASAPAPAVQPAPAAAPRPATVAAAAPAPAPAAPAPAPAPTPGPTSGGEQVTAPLPGKIISVAVRPGDSVRKGDELCVIEAMKMGNSIKAQRDGIVQDVLVSPGDSVGFGAPLLVMG